MSRKPTDVLSFALDILNKARPILFVLGFALVAFGFDFKTPKAQFDEIRNTASAAAKAENLRIDSLNYRVTALEQDKGLLKSLAIGQCLDRSKRELILMQLPCDKLIPMQSR